MEMGVALLSLQRFKKLAETHLDILQKHERKIKTLRSQGELESGKREEVNAQRTMRQLISDFQQILSLQRDLDPLTLEEFRKDLEPLKDRIRVTIENIDSLVSLSPPIQSNTDASWSFCDSPSTQLDASTSMAEEERGLGSLAAQVQRDAASQQELSRDILELQGLMQDFATLVHTQHETVESIEQHVENAHSNLIGGETDLKKSVKYKTASYPLAGGLIGAAAAAGPVGLLVGLKVALVAGIGGGIAGAFGGKFMRNKATQDTQPPSQDEWKRE